MRNINIKLFFSIFIVLIFGTNLLAQGSSSKCSVLLNNVNFDKSQSFAPCITLDTDKNFEQMYFTSSEPLQGKPFKASPRHIYVSKREVKSCGFSFSKDWSKPEPLQWDNASVKKYGSYNICAMAVFVDEVVLSLEIVDTSTGKNKPQKDLFLARIVNGKLSSPRPLTELNDPKYDDTDPAYSQDGTKIFFSSNRKGGKGGFDIYYSLMQKEGWGKPRSITSINSRVDEISPHCGSDGNFYFSSGWDYERYSLSANGKEIFVSKLKRSGLPNYPRNLNKFFNGEGNCYNSCESYNSKDDDIYPCVSPDGTYILISSNKNSNSKEYNIFSYVLRKPKIALKVNIIENVYNNKGYKVSSKLINDKVEIALTDWNGIKKVYNANASIILDPNCIYDIEPIVSEESCMSGSFQVTGGSTIETVLPAYCDTVLIKEFTFKKDHISEKINLSSNNFVTGYWKPMLYDNFVEFRARVDSGFFNKSGFVDTKFNDKAKVYTIENNNSEAYVKIDNVIRKYYDCLSDKGQYMRISVLAYYDEKVKRSGIYCDGDVTINNKTIKNGTKISPGKKANNTLSQLRAVYMEKALKDMMQRRSNFYNALEKKGRIYYDVLGMGKHAETMTSADANNVVIYIDLGPKEWLEKNPRLNESDIETAPVLALNTTKSVAKKTKKEVKKTVPKKKIKKVAKKTKHKKEIKKATKKPEPKKDTKKIADAASVKNIKKSKTEPAPKKDLHKTKIDKTKKAEKTIAKETPKKVKKTTKATAKKVKKPVEKKKPVKKKKTFARKIDAGTKSLRAQKKYTISFGSYRKKSNSENVKKYLESNNIQNVRIVEVQLRNRTYYRVRSGYYSSWKEARQNARELARLLRKGRVRAPAKAIME